MICIGTFNAACRKALSAARHCSLYKRADSALVTQRSHIFSGKPSPCQTYKYPNRTKGYFYKLEETTGKMYRLPPSKKAIAI